MIEEIDRRLHEWAEYRVGGAGGGGLSVLAALIAGQGQVVRSTATEVYVPDRIIDTGDAVAKLEKDYRRIIHLQYLDTYLRPDQRARKARCSRMTFYRRLHSAHLQVLMHLKPPKPLRTRTIGDRLATELRNGRG